MQVSGAVLTFALCCHFAPAQQVRIPPVNTRANLPEQAQAAIRRVQPKEDKIPDFAIESTQVKLLDVVEAPPMAGLPPVVGTIRHTVHKVADPGLLESGPEVVELNTEPFGPGATEPIIPNHMAMISAMVYDGRRTKLTCRSSAGHDDVTAWSNVNFNHLRSATNFEVTSNHGESVTYALIMSIGNENTALQQEIYQREGLEWIGPIIPEIPDGAPAFVLETVNPDPESLKLLEALHALYRDEGIKLAEIEAARQQADDERRARLLANPPKPKDVTIHFWKRNAAQTQAGQP